MAIWNNQVRGNVISIQTAGEYDPMEIIGDSNPMPTPDNRMGFGNFKAVTKETSDGPFKYPEMDAMPERKKAKGSDPFAGMDNG